MKNLRGTGGEAGWQACFTNHRNLLRFHPAPRFFLAQPKRSVIAFHRLLLVVGSGVDILLHTADRSVPKKCGESGQINAGFGHPGSEGMPEVVRYESDYHSLLKSHCDNSVVSGVDAADMLAFVSSGWKDPT